MSAPPPDLNEQLDRLEGVLPTYLARPLHILRHPGLYWVRIVAGVSLIAGGVFWFLPILGLEMIPVGLALLAIDVPFLRGPVARMIAWCEQMAMPVFALWVAVRARLQRAFAWRR